MDHKTHLGVSGGNPCANVCERIATDWEALTDIYNRALTTVVGPRLVSFKNQWVVK